MLITERKTGDAQSRATHFSHIRGEITVNSRDGAVHALAVTALMGGASAAVASASMKAGSSASEPNQPCCVRSARAQHVAAAAWQASHRAQQDVAPSPTHRDRTGTTASANGSSADRPPRAPAVAPGTPATLRPLRHGCARHRAAPLHRAAPCSRPAPAAGSSNGRHRRPAPCGPGASVSSLHPGRPPSPAGWHPADERSAHWPTARAARPASAPCHRPANARSRRAAGSSGVSHRAYRQQPDHLARGHVALPQFLQVRPVLGRQQAPQRPHGYTRSRPVPPSIVPRSVEARRRPPPGRTVRARALAVAQAALPGIHRGDGGPGMQLAAPARASSSSENSAPRCMPSPCRRASRPS